VTEINRAGESASLGDINSTQGEFREQIDALTDAVRQLGGKAEIAPGTSTINDPLSAPYVLYVNSYTGQDTFVAGDYASADDGTFDAKMRRISLQRLECGYTEARPFKTINRAIIEAGIITSRDYLNLPGNICGDLVSIVVMPGIHTALNGPGLADTTSNFPAYGTTKNFTDAELQSFNPDGGSGIMLPRGCSLVSLDLRKCNIRPDHVPGNQAAVDEAADYSNRGSIFLVTGTGFYYGFTFLDKANYPYTHHLLHTFEFAGRTRTDEFYSKILKSFGSVAGISSTFTKTRTSEVQIVGPAPAPGTQTQTTDSVSSASPYIFNCSIRSLFGMGGIFANGANAEGFKSMVTAQYTAISMQKDMRCWQRYSGGNWSAISTTAAGSYGDYIDESPDNVRMDPAKRSFHVRCVNRAIIQEVSVFAIGQGVHHWVESGGELTTTNSNSNFGGCASLAEGFNSTSFATDKNWNIATINVARDISGLADKFQRYDLGTLATTVANNATTITLTVNLEGTENDKPTILSRNGYSLGVYGGTSYIWIENPNGVDYYAPLAGNAWRTSNPNEINVSAAFVSADGGTSPSTDAGSAFPPLAGKKIYVRRLRDVRTLDERSYSLTCNNTAATSRNIIRDYGIQVDVGSSVIDSEFAASEPVIAGTVTTLPVSGAGVTRVNQVEVRRAAASAAWDNSGEYRTGYHLANNYYRTGDIVRYQNKHYKCIVEHIAESVFDSTKFDEAFVHMEDNFAAEDFFKNSKPVIIFDRDKDNTLSNSLLGYTNADLGTDAQLYRQIRTAVDYLGVYSLLRSLGFNDADSHTILLPKPLADRNRNPNTALDGIGNPSAAANAWDNWAITMRRPSQIRLFGHAMEWAGYLNYSKALPQYQLDLTPSNKFSYYFTNQLGGRVYISAFNEEGFQITAAGLTDLATGTTLSPEGLGGDDPASNITIFNGDVNVNGTLTANSIESTQQSLVKIKDNNDQEVSEGRGMSWIAPAEAIPDVSVADAATFNTANQDGTAAGPTNIGSNGYSGPHFVTPYFLDLWKAKNGLLGKVPGTVKIYVNPRAVQKAGNFPNPANNESYNYNASITDLLSRPPTSPDAAVKTLALAIEFANLSVATTTTIQYYLGPGIYTDTGTRVFTHPVQLLSYDYATNNLLTDGVGGGQVPFLGTTNSGRGPSNSGRSALTGSSLESHIKNADNHPVFLTRVYHQARNVSTQNEIRFDPLTLQFEKDAIIQGVVWWGATTTLEQLQGTSTLTDQLVPNSLFSQLNTAQLQTVTTQSNRGQVINSLVYQLISANSSTNNIDYISNTPCIVAYDQLRIRDMAITATGLPFFNLGTNSNQPVIELRNNGVLRLNGTYFIGNNVLDNTGYANQGSVTTPTFRSETSYKHFGFGPAMFSMGNNSSNSVGTFQFCGWGSPIRVGPSNFVWNTTYINIHLMTREYQYMAEADTQYGGTVTTVDANQGPAWPSIVGRLTRNRRTISNHFVDYRTASDASRSGFAGNFGRYQRGYGTITTGWRSVGLSVLPDDGAQSNPDPAAGDPVNGIPSGSYWDYRDRPFFIRRNNSGSETPSGATFLNPGYPASPEIISRNYTYGTGAVRLNCKYAVVDVGIDYDRNYNSNRLLFA
jgi:hypothetical protein